MNGSDITDAKTQPLPSWLELPAAQEVLPPTESAEQILPFHELTWENFERLCLRLARLDRDVQECRLYGMQGDDQGGIDFYARSDGGVKLVVYQSKRVRNFGPSKIIAAFDAFITSESLKDTAEFVLCTSESLRSAARDDEWNRQRERLGRLDIHAIRWDAEELSLLLKEAPEIVFDFFGPAWFRRFFLRDPSEFSRRLTPSEVTHFRQECRDFYNHVFDQADPGLPLGFGHESHRLSLLQRYVVPDIEEDRKIAGYAKFRDDERPRDEADSAIVADAFRSHYQTARPDSLARSVTIRVDLDSWLSQASQTVVLGEPGAGKSSLLRFVALNLLNNEPSLPRVARKWGSHLPVWVPFPFWVAQVAHNAGESLPLSDILRRWFEHYDRKDLWPLVQRALNDDRLLLLIEGIDEWHDEAAARIVLDQLIVFIRGRDVPSILVSRPQGFDRLRDAIPVWPTGHLARLSPQQQARFAIIWFTEDCGRELELGNVSTTATVRTAAFLRDLGDAPDFAELAGVPLLLGLLIRLTMEQLELPRDRFEAYDRMIDLLLELHPRSRRAASQLLDTGADELRLGGEDLKDAYAALAWKMQSQTAEGTTDEISARGWIEAHLCDLRGLGFPVAAGRSVARTLLQRAETEYGLFVSKGAKTLGFFHRTCQEALAARHLRSLPVEEQQRALRMFIAEPAWSEVLLAFLHGEPKPHMRTHIQTLAKLGRDADLPVRCHIDRLLAQIGFGEAQLYPEDRVPLIETTFRAIERGDYVSHRRALLLTALGALRAHSYVPRHAVQLRARRWFPAFLRDRSRMFGEMAGWQKCGELSEVLLTNLNDEEAVNARAAAEAIVVAFRGEKAIGDELAAIARQSANPIARASSLEALQVGWQDRADLSELAAINRESGAAAPALVAISMAVQQHRQKEADRDLLLLHSHYGIGLLYSKEWREKLITTLIQGWSGDLVLKSAALSGCRERMYREGQIDQDVAFPLLLFGYPGDNEAAETVIQALNEDKYHFGWRNLPDRKNLSQWAAPWSGHRILEPGMEAWLREHGNTKGYAAIDLYYFAKTDGIKRWMIECLDKKKTLAGLSLHVVLRLWGMDDPMVADAIRRYVAEFPHGYAESQDQIFKVTEDIVVARSKVMASLKSDDFVAARQALMTLKELDGHLAADDVVQTCLALSQSNESWRDHFLPNLIGFGSAHPTVRALAVDYLNAFDCNEASVARGLADDPHVRAVIYERSAPLPTSLREVLSTKLEGMPLDNSFADELLRRYRYDNETEVTSAAAVSLGRRDLRRTAHSEELAQDFLADLMLAGSAYNVRRVSGLAGLFAAQRFDLLPTGHQEKADPMDQAMEVFTLGRANAFRRLLAENWSAFEAQFGASEIGKFLHLESGFMILSAFRDAPPGSAAARWALEYSMRATPSRPITDQQLEFLAVAYPRSERLRETCLPLVRQPTPTSKPDIFLAITAAKLLGDSFKGDEDTCDALLAGIESEEWSDATIVALCRGWPEHKSLRKWFDHAVATAKTATWPAFWHTLACFAGPQKLAAEFRRAENPLEREERLAFSEAAPVLAARILRDGPIVDWLVHELRTGESHSMVVTALWLLREAGLSCAELDQWLEQKAAEFGSHGSSPIFGRNLFEGVEQSVSELVLASRS